MNHSARGLLASLVVVAAAALTSARAAPVEPRINANRLQSTLEQLSTYGRPAGGTFADGVSRFAYSDADVAGREYAIQLMRAAGLNPHIDAAGNISGTRDGKNKNLKPIVIGSHIDSVPSGGNFDGQVGSMGAIEVVRTLNDQHINTQHPIEVILWSNEEGGTIGSAALLQTPDATSLERTYNGIRLRDGLKKIGGDPDNLARARRAAGTLHAYLELHVEQGDTLEKAGASIGIVDGIVSIDDYDVQVIGFANHAGTTTMNNRQDALLAASRMVETVNEVATSLPGRQVGTVGRFNVFPNVPNVIPGRVTLSVEFRDLSADTIAKLGELTSERARQIGKDTRTEISMNHVEHLDAALADARIQQLIGSAADTLGLKSLHLPSGAGHDAQNLAKLGPMGMIFVPSIGGISHSPKELTRWSDVANGADVLLRTVLRVDRISLPPLSPGHKSPK